jgi:hypothetical protein
MKGGGAAGVATLGAAGVEVAQQVLAETQTAILPLVPYLDTLRWVFIAVALGGIAVTIYARSTTGAGAAVIGGLLATLAGSAWARAALRYGVTPSRSFCSCWPCAAPASAPGGWPNASRPWRKP